MASRSIGVVPPEEVERWWREEQVVQKVAAGLLYETIVHRVTAGDPRWPGGESRIVVIRTHNRNHIGTRHKIALPDGSVPHNHPKDYTLRDCSRIRAP